MQTDTEPRAQAEEDPQAWTMPTLYRAEWVVIVLVFLGAAAVGLIGLYSSFDNVAEHMRDKGFEHPELVPLAVDIAIPVFGMSYLLLLRVNIRLDWVRWLSHALVGVTIYLNVTSTNELDAQVGHTILPLLWVAFTEVIAHFYRVQIGRANGTHTDPIPRKRWIFSPIPTFLLWRRMHLWEITSYRTALDLEEQRIRAVTALRKRYGRFGWRWHTPLDLKTELRLGRLTPHQVWTVDSVPTPPTATPDEPTPAALPVPAQREAQPELENTTEQTALPTGTQAATDEGDTPYTPARTTLLDTAPAPTVETTIEREAREESERRQLRQDNYEKAVAVVLEYVEQNQPISGPRLASDDRIPVGARSVQRYLDRMVKEGVVSADLVKK
ncbi:hypothetical protein GCM10009801_72880 [Streptomyces albiaxialis]|uniref:DUF2637 domain-containing protein n=1 Tax=Streptomyces albiaxialis TaxID=329523 RepID=A0ABN2WX13_9ACTN